MNDASWHAAGLRGIAANPSTPPDLLRRLAGRADTAPALLGREHLPPAVVAALAVHPASEVRRRLVGHRSTPGGVRAALARDPDPEVRAEVADPPDRRTGRVDTPVEAYRALAADPDPAVRAAVARNRRVPQALRARLADDADPGVRRAVAWSVPPIGVVHRLVGDPDRTVCREALSTARVAAPTATVAPRLVERLLTDPDDWYRRSAISLVALTPELVERFRDERAALARNPSLPPDLMPGFLDVGPALAENPNLTAPVLAALVATMDPEVHRELLNRTALPDHLRRQLLAADEDDEPLPYVASLDPRRATIEERLSYLDHPNPAFRRTLALSPDLPPHAVQRLAADPDWPTRLLICERHTDVPPDVLVEVAEGHPGHSRWDLFRHPRLPADAMARNAAGDDPLARHAIATRTDLPPELTLRLTEDPDRSVRRAAAANPALPLDRIRRLVDGADEDLREAAAGNPTLPVDDIRRISSAASGGPS